jgi:hypothetical protein
MAPRLHEHQQSHRTSHFERHARLAKYYSQVQLFHLSEIEICIFRMEGDVIGSRSEYSVNGFRGIEFETNGYQLGRQPPPTNHLRGQFAWRTAIFAIAPGLAEH